MKLLQLSLLFLLSFSAFSQEYNADIDSLIVKTNIDSLVSYVRILSGEDSARIGDAVIINNDRVAREGRILAAAYIKQKLEGYGLPAIEQDYSTTGKNIYAVQTGTEFPDKQVIICAHYDAVPVYAADDNASSTATVLEAARILSAHQLPYTIVYALWDEEEIGLIGSTYYAQQAAVNGDEILGVINLDMIAWDSNNDMVMEIHTQGIGHSNGLAGLLVNINTTYDLGLVTEVINPGATYSDHSSFWNSGYGAVLMIEDASHDFNAYYHTPSDRIDQFNLPYFHAMSKLAVGGIATLAYEGTSTITSIENNVFLSDGCQLMNYPNPFSEQTTVSYALPERCHVNIAVINNLGQNVAQLISTDQNRGSHTINFDGTGLQKGIYTIVMSTSTGQKTHKILLLK